MVAVACSICPEELPKRAIGSGETHHKDWPKIRSGTSRLNLLCLYVASRDCEQVERFGGMILVVEKTVGIVVERAVEEGTVAAQGMVDAAVAIRQYVLRERYRCSIPGIVRSDRSAVHSLVEEAGSTAHWFEGEWEYCAIVSLV